jgi:hypothetical protein
MTRFPHTALAPRKCRKLRTFGSYLGPDCSLAEAVAPADSAAAGAAIGADVPGWRAGADAIQARAAAADINAIGAGQSEGQASTASTPTASALARAAAAKAAQRAGVEAGAAVPGVTREVDANPAAVGLPGWAPCRRWIGPRADTSPGDVGADTGQPHAVEAAGGGILAAAAFRVAGARDTEGGTGAAVAVSIAGLAATAATGADTRTLVAIAHAVANLVLGTKADAAATRAAGLALLGAGGRRYRCRADPRYTGLTRRAGFTADPAVDHAGHQVGAVVAAVGRPGGTLRRDAYAVLTVGVYAGVPRDGTTGVAAGAAVLVVTTEVPA